jgi:hypothetical protein
MTTNEGYVALNLLCYDGETKEKVFEQIKALPSGVRKFVVEGEEDVNKVIILCKHDVPSEEDRLSQMEKLLKEWGLNKGTWLTEMRVKEKIGKLLELH